LPIAVSEEVAATVRAALTRAFWARIKEDLPANPPVYDSLLPVLEELREGVCEIALRGWAAKAAWFADLFDVGFLRERLAGGGGLGMDFWGSRCAAAMDTLIELDMDSAEAERGIGSGGRGGMVEEATKAKSAERWMCSLMS